jgi:small-conductance mechanosensitive channel/CRP-like cAMP-binding protein
MFGLDFLQAGGELGGARRLVEGVALLAALWLGVRLLQRRGASLGWSGPAWALFSALGFALRGLWPSGLGFGLALVVVVLTGVVIFAALDALVLARPWAPQRGPMLPRLAKDMLRVALILALVLWVAASRGDQSLKAVLVSSTVVSAVLGFALQDVLKNVFAGLALDLEKPFQRGDWLVLPGMPPAEVIDITWRSTWLRTAEGHEFFEPNATMNNARLEIFGRGQRPVAFALMVGLPYELAPTEARALLLDAARRVEMAATSPAPEVFLDHFGDSAIVYQVRVWTHEVARLTRFRDQVQSRVWFEVTRRGHQIPVPIRTVRLHQAAEEAQQQLRSRRGDTARRLRATPFFASLEAARVDELASRARSQLWEPGEELVREGDPGDSLFVVTRGRLEVLQRGEKGAVVVGHLAEDDFFGEASLLTGSPRSATVRAVDPTEVLMLSREALAPTLEADPGLAEVLSNVLAERRARSAASLESDHRRREAGVSEADSLLDRVRSFFRLG